MLRSLGRGLTNKLLHEPSVQVRKATAEGRAEVTEWLRELHQISSADAAGALKPVDDTAALTESLTDWHSHDNKA